MKLQIRYNMTNLEKALSLATQTEHSADILELGTLLLLSKGVNAIQAFSRNFPEKDIYADARILTNAAEIVTLVAQAGARYISVLAGASKYTIREACQTAKKYNAKIVLDCIDAYSAGESARDAQTLGVHALLMHRSPRQGETYDLESDWNMVRDNTTLPIFIKGKIDHNILRQLLPFKTEGFVIGSAITTAADPEREAERIKNLLS